MSSLFKKPKSFQSKQSRSFTDLTSKALPSVSREDAYIIYKSIKNGKNAQWSSLEDATNCLGDKYKLNIQMGQYEKIIHNKTASTLRQIQSAKMHLVKLSISAETTSILRNLEKGFNLEKGSLTPKQIMNNAHLQPNINQKVRSHSVSKTRGIDIQTQKLLTYIHTYIQIGIGANKSKKEKKTQRRNSNTIKANIAFTLNTPDFNEGALNENEEEIEGTMAMDDQKQKDEQINNDYGISMEHSPRLINYQSQSVPSMNSKEYLQFLLERAMTNKAFNDNDLDRLCKCAISLKCDWITVHSMWVPLCAQLLLKHTIKKYKDDLKKYKKSNRRGSKVSFNSMDFKTFDNEKDIKSNTNICVTIGYPLGQTSTIGKVAETKESVKCGAKRIRLMISAGKVVMEDWPYIINEVKSVVAAGDGVDVRIVFPETSQITDDLKHKFNQQIMHRMANKHSPNSSMISEGDNTKKRGSYSSATSQRRSGKLKCTFSDEDTSSEEEEVEASAADDDEIVISPKHDIMSPKSVTSVTSVGSARSSMTEPGSSKAKISSKAKEYGDDDGRLKPKLNMHSQSVRLPMRKKKSRRGSTQTLRKKNKNNVSIGQSVTDSFHVEPGATDSLKKKSGKKRKKMSSTKKKKKKKCKRENSDWNKNKSYTTRSDKGTPRRKKKTTRSNSLSINKSRRNY